MTEKGQDNGEIDEAVLLGEEYADVAYADRNDEQNMNRRADWLRRYEEAIETGRVTMSDVVTAFLARVKKRSLGRRKGTSDIR